MARLATRGCRVYLGLDEYYAGAIGFMSRQPHIVEYCFEDAGSRRFASRDSCRRWLEHAGGRAVFLLLGEIDGEEQLAGYGWSGLRADEAADAYPITSAYRIGADFRRQGLGKDFIQSVVSATYHLFAEGRGVGLETWQGNPAVNAYRALGFIALGPPVEGLRPTLNPFASDGIIADQRLRMGYPRELLSPTEHARDNS